MQNWTRLSNSTLIKLIWVTIRRLFWFGIITNYSINPIGLTWVPNVTNVIFFSLCRMVTLAQKLKILDFFLLEFKRNSCMNFGNKKILYIWGKKSEHKSFLSFGTYWYRSFQQEYLLLLNFKSNHNKFTKEKLDFDKIHWATPL